ncbi:MAG TPA: ABC transporter substrate-binding protein [Opitutaceae bacterium]
MSFIQQSSDRSRVRENAGATHITPITRNATNRASQETVTHLAPSSSRLRPSASRFIPTLTAFLALSLSTFFTGCKPTAAAHNRAIDAAAAQRASSSAESSAETFTYPATDYQETTPGRDGGTLRVSTPIDNGSLDLNLLADTSTKWMGRLIFDNLVYLDNEGNITPWLATSWTISPDGKTYVFKLRDGVSFSDGTPFDAEAVRVNLERIRDPRTKTRMTTAYIAPYIDGRVIDRFTFQANLREPYSAFLNVLAQSWFGLVSPKQIHEDPKSIGERPIGTGPFTVASYVRQRGLVFEKRRDYAWPPPFMHRRNGPAYLDRIEVEFIPEALLRYTGLTSGQTDFTTDAPPQNAAALRADSRFVLTSRINLGNPVRNPTFNVTKPPFDDVRVRLAVARAIDREGIAQLVGFGEYRVKTDFLSADTRYYDPTYRNALSYDPAAANRLLNEAGWTGRDAEGFRTKNGTRLSAEFLTTESASTPATAAVAIQSDLKKIGFEIRVVQLPMTQMTDRRLGNDYQLIASGYWHTNTPDGLFIVYEGEQVSPRYTGQNISRLQDPQLDDLLSRARHATEPSELRDLYSRAQHRLTELAPAVPLYENHTIIAYRRYVHGVVYDTSHNTAFLACVWLAEDERS